jgi:hypothetical protein
MFKHNYPLRSNHVCKTGRESWQLLAELLVKNLIKSKVVVSLCSDERQTLWEWVNKQRNKLENKLDPKFEKLITINRYFHANCHRPCKIEIQMQINILRYTKEDCAN